MSIISINNLSAGGGSGTGGNVPTGGSMGQVLTKRSATDYDTYWSTIDNKNPNINYSLQDHKVGKWLDGKVLWEKTISVTLTTQLTNGTKWDTGLDHNNTDMVWIHEAFFIDARSDYKQSCIIPLIQDPSTGKVLTLVVDLADKSKIIVKANDTYGADIGRTFYITLRYTRISEPSDVQTWLAYAGISRPSYVDIEDVLEDTEILPELFANADATNYLVRATDWIMDICNDSYAMSVIGSLNSTSNTLLANEDWTLGIANSTYYSEVLNAEIPVMTSNDEPSGTASSDTNYGTNYAYKAMDGDETTSWSTPGQQGSFPHWLRYDFETSMVAHCFSLLVGSSASTRACILQAYDGSSWVDLLSFTEPSDNYANLTTRFINNSASYEIYRLSISNSYNGKVSSARIFQLYGRRDV